MNRPSLQIVLIVGLLFALSLAPLAVQTTFAETGALGQHTVRSGETLYCLGRAYRVDPRAIAEANNLRSPYRLSVGQTLTIPAVRWERIPGGPTCAAQFSSPYTTGGGPATTPIAQPSSTTGSGLRHVVRSGETVYCIGRAYRVVPNAILRANGLTANRRIFPGMVLTIPNVPWTNIPAGPTCGAQDGTASVQAAQAVVAATPTPTCEEGSYFDTLMNLCRRPDEPTPEPALPTPMPTMGYPGYP